jgi:hypothetical protein
MEYIPKTIKENGRKNAKKYIKFENIKNI